MNYKNLCNQKVDHVQNLTTYNGEMQKALIDKIFFLDKVDNTNVFVDYGCANGALIQLSSKILPEATFIGYDLAPEMIAEAQKVDNKSCTFTDSLNFLRDTIKGKRRAGNKICLSIISLIHEVYHYGPAKVKDFWEFVFSEDLFDYIAIRDMCVSSSTSRPADSLSVAKIRMRYDKDMIAQWESNWGSLSENWSLVHFLLTYRYVNSWERELRENYLPVNLENLMALIPAGWGPTYVEHYTLPFIRQQIIEDFSIDLQDRTHLKLILKKV